MSENILERIDSLDLEPIVFKLVNPEPGETGMSVEEADSAAQQYRQFLKIIAMYPKKSIVPTKLIDEVWHTHILDTAKYAEDCQEIFGYFLHHFPYLGMRGSEDVEEWMAAHAETRDLFARHFNVVLSSNAMECGGGCDAGGFCDYSAVPPSSNPHLRPQLVRS